ncbi:MAG: phage integrase SAM-like domain-containing protein [Candidatus Cloacimonetes bacterium]|nr:phage integrase SAM-like domain-containing protein [Candidatus Cloacimonadota bacterium]
MRVRKTKRYAMIYADYYDWERVRRQPSLGLQLTGCLRKDEEIIRTSKKKLRDIEKSDIPREVKPNIEPEIDFITYFRETISRKTSDRNYRTTLTLFLKFNKSKSLPINKFDNSICQGFQDYLLNQKFSRSTANTYLRCFRYVINNALKHDIITRNPARHISSIRFEKKGIECLTIVEIERLNSTPYDYQELKAGFISACFSVKKWSTF